jgi:hypothetical protein
VWHFLDSDQCAVFFDVGNASISVISERHRGMIHNFLLSELRITVFYDQTWVQRDGTSAHIAHAAVSG